MGRQASARRASTVALTAAGKKKIHGGNSGRK
jgi:hypothetical protein